MSKSVLDLLYRQRIIERLDQQTDKGIKKYGQVLNQNDKLTVNERIDHLAEELTDALVYLEHLRESVEEDTPYKSLCSLNMDESYEWLNKNIKQIFTLETEITDRRKKIDELRDAIRHITGHMEFLNRSSAERREKQ